MLCSEKMLASSNYRVLRGHFGGITQMLFLPNSQLVSCSYDGTIKIWNQEDGKQIQNFGGGDEHFASVISIAALSGTDLAAGYADGQIRIWNLKNGSLARTLKVEPTSSSVHPAIHSLTALPGGRLAFSTCDNVIKIFDLNEDNRKPPSSIKSEGASSDFLPLGVSSDGSLISYHWHQRGNSSLNVWNPINGDLIKSVHLENSLADCFKVLSGDRVALGSGHGTIEVIDLNTSRNQLSLVKCHRDGVWAIEELVTGGSMLVTGGSIQDASINVWNSQTGDQVASVKSALIGHDEHISSLCVTKDGRVLASAGSYSDAIKLWPSFIN